MLYLDNNATTVAPKVVIDNAVEWMNQGNPSAGYKSAIRARDLMLRFRLYIAAECNMKVFDDDEHEDLQKNRISVGKEMLKRLVVGNTTHISQKIDDRTYRILFTSGATESNCTMIRMCADAYAKATGVLPHFVASAVEHKCILLQLEQLRDYGLADFTLVKPDKMGFMTVSAMSDAIKPNTCLVICMHANNETGAIMPINEIGKACHGKNVAFFTDAAQTFGKIPIDIQHIDGFAASFHKTHGLPGVGILVIKEEFLRGYKLHGMLTGSQNYGLRGGTENIPGIAAAYEGMKYSLENREKKNANLRKLKKSTIDMLCASAPCKTYREYIEGTSRDHTLDIVFLSLSDEKYLPGTLLLSVVKKSTEGLKMCNVEIKNKLADKSIIISVGSACNTTSDKASHVLYAMDADAYIRRGTLRISMGDGTTIEDMKKFVKGFIDTIKDYNT